jgi:hypothetical protein
MKQVVLLEISSYKLKLIKSLVVQGHEYNDGYIFLMMVMWNILSICVMLWV